MIKAIFFDFDGVLTREFNGSGNICKNLCKAIPSLSYDSVMNCYRKHCGRLLVETGTYSDVEENFCECIGLQIPSEVYKDAQITNTRNDEMFALVESLRGNYMLGIITDNSEERMNLIDDQMQLSNLFKTIVISSVAHALKHDGTTSIFDTAISSIQCNPEECIFIDNQERNLTIPKQMGMKTYWHDDKKNDVSALKAKLEEWGVVL